MSCYACSKKYGFFCKEVGCPNCGFSFCTKCLKKSIQVPKCGNAERKVCLACFEKISKQSASMGTSESLAKSKNMSVLDAPIPEAETLPDIDDEIKKRLESVKQPMNDLEGFSDQSISERLANLKEMPHKEYDNRKMLNKIDNRTEHEKANDLVNQFMAETNIDNAVQEFDPLKDIEQRLAALKAFSGSSSNTSEKKDSFDNSNELIDEDTLAKKIVTKYLDEAALPDSDLTPDEKEFVNSIPKTQDNEELPWCTICNEDASIRCIGCDGDLFCKGCFKEIHANDEEYREHRTKQYIPKETETQ